MMADGLLGKCKLCTKKDVLANRLANPERLRTYERERNKQPERRAAAAKRLRAYPKEKRRATLRVRWAILAGILTRGPCEVCGEPKSEGHHDDYSKPLDVRWLCRTHHMRHHGALRRTF